MPQEWGAVSVEAQEYDPGSMLTLFRSAIRLRPRDDRFSWRESPAGTMSFERGDLTCLVNFDAAALELPEGELLLASEPGIETTLPASTSAWIRTKGAT
jgi:alpha-glucosidase